MVDFLLYFAYILLMHTEELWLPAIGCEGYLVSSFGRIKSLLKGREVEIKPFAQNKGYLQIGITNGGKKTNKTVHSIVAESFIGKRNGMDINHKDGDKKNNKVENLEYMSHIDNVRHAIANGLFSYSKSKGKITQEIADEIRRDKANTGRVNEYYAARYNVNKSNISHIINFKTWK